MKVKDCEKGNVEERWQFPNCVGAAHGKHISFIHARKKTEFYNLKGFSRLAFADFYYKCL